MLLWQLGIGAPAFMLGGWWLFFEKPLQTGLAQVYMFGLAWFALVSATSAVAEGVFVMRRGVYPIGRWSNVKQLRFVYDDQAHLHRLGEIQAILGAALTMALVVSIYTKLGG